MTVIRLTEPGRRALHVRLPLEAEASSTHKLSEWYATFFPSGRGAMMVLMNAPTRLAILSRDLHPVRMMREVPRRLQRLLEGLEVPQDIIADEVDGLGSYYFAKTIDRRFTGSLVEICRQLAYADQHIDLQDDGEVERFEDEMLIMPHLQMADANAGDAVGRVLGCAIRSPGEPRGAANADRD